MNHLPKIYLASSSLRRQELLKQIGVEYDLLSIHVDETQKSHEDVAHFVKRLATEKARAGLQIITHQQQPVLGADTVVLIHHQILGKPKGKTDFIQMLSALSGQVHTVLTAVCLASPKWSETILVETAVKFRQIDSSEMLFYWEKYLPTDKAGGYAIQDYGAVFVDWIKGSYSNVVGLPLRETYQLLTDWQQTTSS